MSAQDSIARWFDIVATARQAALFALVIVAAYTDLARGKVYNWCTYGGIGLGLAFGHVLDGFTGTHSYLTNSLLGLVLGAAVLTLPYFFGWIGGGDVKLLAAIGALGGAQMRGCYFIFYVVFYAALVGAMMGIGTLIWQRRLLAGLKSSLRLLWRLKPTAPTNDSTDEPSQEIPFGLAIALGTMWAWFVFLERGLVV